MLEQTTYDQDMLPVPPATELAILVDQNPDRVTYAVREPLDTWAIHQVNVATGQARHGRASYRCFLEAVRAHRAGAVIWEG